MNCSVTIIRAILALTTGHVLVFGYLLATGMQAFAHVGPPLIINLIDQPMAQPSPWRK